VKAEARSVRGADPFMRDQTQHQCASRQTISVNNDALTRRAHCCEGFQIATDLTAAIVGDPHSRGRRSYAERHCGDAQNQTPNMHSPVPLSSRPALIDGAVSIQYCKPNRRQTESFG
jgi:hypothetical protein